MKAIVQTKYGSPDVLELKEVEVPTPTDNQVLVKTCAASINKADYYLLKGPFVARVAGGGLMKPKRIRLGSDVAGTVEAVGGGVKQLKLGDEVFGAAPGAIAEYACARQDLLVLKPSNVTFDEAAAVPVAAITALQGLRDKGRVQSGQKVLIDGASGGVGTFAVQIAKSFGAEVTAVCSTKNLDTARAIGADHAIDYSKEDFTKREQRYDLVLAVNGHHSILDYRHVLSPNGRYLMVGSSRLMSGLLQTMLLGPVISHTSSKKMGFMGIAKLNQQDLIFLKELLETGKLKPVIDRRFPFSETTEAFRYFGEGHARGKVIITME